MFKQIIIGLFVVSMVPILWSEADAAITCKTILGKRICRDWSIGSANCKVKSVGLESEELECSAFGTEQVTGNPACDPDSLDPDCGIRGKIFCSPDDPGTDATFPTFLTETTTIGDYDDGFTVASVEEDTCEGNKCTTVLALEAGDFAAACTGPTPPGFPSFRPFEFNAVVEVCPGGRDVNDACCFDFNRTTGGECVTPGFSFIDRCSAKKLGEERRYVCHPL